MSNIGLVIHREYTTRVRKKSFLVLTILMPVLFVGLIAGTVLLAMKGIGDIKNIVVVDNTGEYFAALKDTPEYHYIKSTKEMEGETDFADFREKSDESIYATLVISDDLLKDPKAIQLYHWNKVLQESASYTISSQLNEYLSEKKLASHNIPNIKEIIADSRVDLKIQAINLNSETTETEGSGTTASLVGMIFTFLIYMFIFSYGGMVMSGVLEEKTNRIIEVMVSSVKPFDLMMGKLIGIGLVGLTQFAVWAVLILGVSMLSGTLLGGNPEMLTQVNNMMGSVNLIELSLYFLLFFICGYLMYAALFAAIGSMVNSQEDTQQYMMPITVLIIFAFMAGTYSAQNPDGPLAFWTSLIPFTSPIVMMVRLPFGVPPIELISSIALLIVTVILTVMLAAKIYRTGILMYGKKPTFKEIVKWLRY